MPPRGCRGRGDRNRDPRGGGIAAAVAGRAAGRGGTRAPIGRRSNRPDTDTERLFLSLYFFLSFSSFPVVVFFLYFFPFSFLFFFLISFSFPFFPLSLLFPFLFFSHFSFSPFLFFPPFSFPSLYPFSLSFFSFLFFFLSPLFPLSIFSSSPPPFYSLFLPLPHLLVLYFFCLFSFFSSLFPPRPLLFPFPKPSDAYGQT